MARWTVREIAAIPTVSDGGPDDPTWSPLQHALGIDTFGANLFVATHADRTLVEEQDERATRPFIAAGRLCGRSVSGLGTVSTS